MTAEEVNKIISSAIDHMNKAIAHLEIELQKIRAGKASPNMLESIHVDYYGTNTPLSQVASVNTPEPRSLVIQPWEKGMIGPIEKAIRPALETLLRSVMPPVYFARFSFGSSERSNAFAAGELSRRCALSIERSSDSR